MPKRFISPTEHDLPHYLTRSIVSWMPEKKFGADTLSYIKGGGRLAIQRKTYPEDFLASMRDHRLVKEIPLLKNAEYPIVILEGTPHLTFTTEGKLMTAHNTHWTKTGIRNAVRSLFANHGIWVEWTTGVQDTADVIMEWEQYLEKTEHLSLMIRPKMYIKDDWGNKDEESTALFFLQGLDGVGLKLARKIYEGCGEKVPLKWSVSKEQFEAIVGKGKVANRIWGQING